MGAKGGHEGKGKGGSITTALNVNLHCGACAQKVKRAVEHFEGVESAAANENYTILTVVGSLDPEKLREKVEQKIHKKAVIISPIEAPKVKKESNEKPEEKKSLDPPKEEEEKANEKPKDEEKEKPKEEEKAKEKPKEEEKAKEKPKEEAKPEPPMSRTVELKIRLHCEGCIKKIRRAICKFKGVRYFEADAQMDLVKVTGFMDVASLPAYLQDKFKRSVDIVSPLPPKKEEGGKMDTGDGGDKKGGEKKGGEAGQDKGRRSIDGERSIVGERSIGGDAEKKKEQPGEKAGIKNKGVSTQETTAEVNKMEYHGGGATTQYYSSGATTTQYHASSSYAPMPQYYDPGSSSNIAPTMHYYHNGSSSNPPAMQQQYYNGGDATRGAYVPYAQPYAQPYPYHVELGQTQLFSDENPNACSVM